MSQLPDELIRYLNDAPAQLRNLIRDATDEELCDLLDRNAARRNVAWPIVHQLWEVWEKRGFTRYIPRTDREMESLLETALQITRTVPSRRKVGLSTGGEVRRKEKREGRSYFDKYTRIKTDAINATLTGYIDHPLSDPYFMLRVYHPYEQTMHFTLAQTELAFALWQIVADQALCIRPIAPLADPSPFRDAAE